ncbi:hypothetical protein K8I28_17420 [bacterium]|nr:hypothetical protein [bacterium]
MNASENQEKKLRWPTDASRVFTSTFGEHRPSRFHAGIDIRTAGVNGYECFAVDDGDIIRVRVDFEGYGKALYLKLKDGRIAVYAHLKGFAPEIEEAIRKLQLNRGWYEVESFFPPGKFSFKRGEVIGYTGDTGAGPPHLHFELRKSMSEPYNPCLEGLTVTDATPPIIRRVAIHPLDEQSEVDGDVLPVIRSVNKETIDPVSFYGQVGLAVEVVDYQNVTYFKLGVQRLDLLLDGKLIHRFSPDTLQYKKNIQSRLHFNFELERAGYSRFHRLYILSGNDLDFYDRNLTGGVIDSKKLTAGKHTVEIVAEDYGGNITRQSWELNVLGTPVLAPTKKIVNFDAPTIDSTANQYQLHAEITGNAVRVELNTGKETFTSVQLVSTPSLGSSILSSESKNHWIGRFVPVSFYRGWVTLRAVAEVSGGKSTIAEKDIFIGRFDKNKAATWESPDKDFEIHLGRYSLWFDLLAGMEKLPKTEETIAPLYKISPHSHPFAGGFEVRFHAYESWSEKALVVYQERAKDNEWTALESVLSPDAKTLQTEVLSFETFSVMLDTIPPTLANLQPANKAALTSAKPMFRVTVDDELSGVDIQMCDLMIDGRSVIWIYDIDKKLIYYQPWENLPDGDHTWELFITDKMNNSTTVQRSFSINTK